VSLHAAALIALAAWTPPDAAQEALHGEFLELVTRNEEAVWRDSFPDHFTAGVLVISADAERVLLNLHRKAGRWFAFGGHLEAGDASVLKAATRECQEESGLSAVDVWPDIAQLDIHPVDFCSPRGTVRHFDIRFVARAGLAATHAASEESTDVRWFDIAELPHLVPELEPSMLALIEIARSRFS
jgi:8-oxo-dGTP pyrophosphatase MutT (NUDIX family)